MRVPKASVLAAVTVAVAIGAYSYNRYQKGIKDTERALQMIDHELQETSKDADKLLFEIMQDPVLKIARSAGDTAEMAVDQINAVVPWSDTKS